VHLSHGVLHGGACCAPPSAFFFPWAIRCHVGHSTTMNPVVSHPQAVIRRFLGRNGEVLPQTGDLILRKALVHFALAKKHRFFHNGPSADYKDEKVDDFFGDPDWEVFCTAWVRA
jgi:hypothetical protein